MDYLEILDPQGKRKHYKLDQPRFLIGREATCDICLAHPNVSRRHAQLQRTEEGGWLLQDLKSLNKVYYNDGPVQQIMLEPGKPVRIGEFRIALKPATTPPESVEVAATDEESSPSWPGLDPGWLEQLQRFQRALLRYDQPRLVLERLADEFQRIARPQLLAVGLCLPEEYAWQVTRGEPTNGAAESLHLAASQATQEDSDVRCWHEGCGAEQTPPLVSPYCMLFPMKGRAGIIGHVYLYRPRDLPMPPAVQRYLSLYANYAGLLWENLHFSQLRAVHRQVELELAQARQIQTGLFPPSFDVDPRLGSYAENLPSVKVSGDYYDVVRTGPDTVAFVIADAMGHGMAAALMMATVRATLRMGLTLGLPWDTLFRGLDSIISQARAGSFVTGVVGQVNLATRELEVAVAGHHPPSILVDGVPVELPDECQTRPWGVEFDTDWRVGRVSLGRGDWSILCYTDGLSDTPIDPHENYGTRRVFDFHRAHHHLDAEDLVEALLNHVAARQQSTTLADDQTLLVLRSIGG